MKRSASRIAIIFALFSAGLPATAQPAEDRGTKEEQEACKPDVFRLCSAVIPDERKIVACLRQNREKLSPACRRVFS